MQGLPQDKREVLAVEAEVRYRVHDVTVQKVRDALEVKDLSLKANGQGLYKILVPRERAEQVSSLVIGSEFAQTKRLGLSNRLFLVTLKKGVTEQTVNLFCKGAIGFGQVVLRTLPWFHDKKEYINVPHRKGLVWNIVSTDNQPLDADSIQEFLQETHPDAHVKKLNDVRVFPQSGWFLRSTSIFIFKLCHRAQLNEELLCPQASRVGQAIKYLTQQQWSPSFIQANNFVFHAEVCWMGSPHLVQAVFGQGQLAAT